MNGKVNFSGKKVSAIVNGHLLKIGIFLLLFTEGILSHVQFLAFVTSKCPTPLDCVGLPSPVANPLNDYRGNISFSKMLHLLEHPYYQCDFGKNHSKFNNLFGKHRHQNQSSIQRH